MRSRPRVAIDARSVFTRGGTGRYVRGLVRALIPAAAEAIDLTLLVSPRHPVDAVPLPRAPHVRLVRSAVDWLDFDDEARRLDAEVEGDLFHAVAGHWLPARVPAVATVHDLTPLVLDMADDDPLRVQCRRMCDALPRARACLADSHATADDLRRFVPAVPAPVVVPLAPDPIFRPVTGEAVLARRGLTRDGFWLSTGFAAPYRNLDLLLEAYARLRPAVPLVIAGRAVVREGPVGERLAALDLRDRVQLLDMVEDDELAALYSSCRLFVRPARYEGFGLPLVEAMACGAPCVSSRAGSLQEVGGDAVRSFDPDDVEDCAAQLAAVDADDALRRDLRARSLARAAGFSWEVTARATLAVYRTVLGVP